MPPEQAQTYQWLVTNLQSRCDVFMGLPDVLSLNFWTAKDPPTGLNAGFWMRGLDEKQQLQVVAALSKHPNACVVYSPALLGFWVGRDPATYALPLVQYITRNFKSIGKRGDYSFQVRNDRQLSADDLSW